MCSNPFYKDIHVRKCPNEDLRYKPKKYIALHICFFSPPEISELPLVRLDVSCNRVSHVPLCYRHLRHLQSISLDNNPLIMPPAHICSKGKYHIFKYLNMEACKRSQEELERHLRPTGFNSWYVTLRDASRHSWEIQCSCCINVLLVSLFCGT